MDISAIKKIEKTLSKSERNILEHYLKLDKKIEQLKTKIFFLEEEKNKLLLKIQKEKS